MFDEISWRLWSRHLHHRDAALPRYIEREKKEHVPASAARTLNAARAGATLLFEDATEDVKTREETAEVDACNENDIVFVLAWVLRSGDFERVCVPNIKKTFRVCIL